jgi:PAS domain S-box-containing protein
MLIDSREPTEAQAELRRSEKRYRSLVKALAQIVWTTDPQGTLLTMIGGEAFVESPAERLSVDAWNQLIHPDDRALIEIAKVASKTHGKPFEARYRMRRMDGQWRYMFIRAVPVLDEQGEVEELVGVTIDLTEQRQAEEQLRQSQKMEAMGQLAGGVAHDFNNVLTVIGGYADMVLKQMGPENRLRSSVAEIAKASQRARGLTGQLLAFSRQQMLGPPAVLNLNALVEDAENMLRRVIGEDVILRCSLAPNLRSIKADAGEIHQVIMNLTVNARDAMANGGHLTIETANVLLDENLAQSQFDVQPGKYVVLTVTDTGIGMEDATKAHIFEPFFTTKGTGKGTGLGLATVYGVVRQAGGHIRVQTEVGKGTSFKVYFPTTEEAVVPVAVPVASPTIPVGTETVLLVEDEDAVREMTAEILASCGYTVLQAANGQEAMALLSTQKKHIHLLVSDVVMPYMGGRELAKQAAKVVPTMGVLFISGYTPDAVMREGVLKAECAFLQKPFTPTDLAHKVREVLDRK